MLYLIKQQRSKLFYTTKIASLSTTLSGKGSLRTFFRESCNTECGLKIAWRFGDASRHEPGLTLRIQSNGFGYPFDAPALDSSLPREL